MQHNITDDISWNRSAVTAWITLQMHFPVEASADSSYVLYIEIDAKQRPFQLWHVTGNSVSEAISDKGKHWKIP